MITDELRNNAIEQVKQELLHRSTAKNRKKDDRTKRERDWAVHFMTKKEGDIK